MATTLMHNARNLQEKHGKMKMKWKPHEDKILTEIISWHGAGHWDSIAIHLPGRSGKQCRERWITFLSPDVKRDEWTKEEDDILVKMQHQYGNQWALIAKFLPGRSSISIKNRFKSLLRHDMKDKSTFLNEILTHNTFYINLTDNDNQAKEQVHETPAKPQVEKKTNQSFIFDFPLPESKKIRLFI